jgi:acyl-CoA synthetase (AMP-forming)/AMP-acid ligase II
MDSLVQVELIAWLEGRFGDQGLKPEDLQTVADCLLAAAHLLRTEETVVTGPDKQAWFKGTDRALDFLFTPANTITSSFLVQAWSEPDRVLLADEASGLRTNRDLVTAVYALLPTMEKIEGRRVGLMMPASVGAAVAYLALLFAGKEPVLVNWTTGPGLVQQCLAKVGVDVVVTARALTSRLDQQGFDHQSVPVTWQYLEEMTAGISRLTKVKALVRGRGRRQDLARRPVAETAAILFTSGSEATPKAVPLSHENIMANGRDVSDLLALTGQDRLLGILPLFHSLGLVGTVILPLCTGLPTVYSPNPHDGRRLAALIRQYRLSTLITTPTFLKNILRHGDEAAFASMRLIFSGAEACPQGVYASLKERMPKVSFCEGYGVTECSPVIAVNSPKDSEPGTIGRLLPSMEMVLLDPESREEVIGPGQGRLLVRGPNVFAGYLDEASSAFVEHDHRQWYDTGDLIERLPSGRLRFAGRLKRFIKLGGEMISLPAIEQALQGCLPEAEGPALAVLAAGEEGQQELVAVATVDLDRRAANDCLQKRGLSPLHAIRRVIRVEALPVLGTGKTDYRALSNLVEGA